VQRLYRRRHLRAVRCSSGRLTGSDAHRRYTVSYASQLTPIPDKLDLADAAPILCAGASDLLPSALVAL
jgi:propanol-preferring alcohol dehydrogenase